MNGHKPFDTLADVEQYLEFAKEHGIAQILAHAPYTLNACAKDCDLRIFAYETMCDDLKRLAHIPGPLGFLVKN